jgi:hypothetical protein
MDTASISAAECNINSIQAAGPKEVSSLGNEIKELQTLIQNMQKIDLNIPTPSHSSSDMRYQRRHSMLDLGQTVQQHQQQRCK